MYNSQRDSSDKCTPRKIKSNGLQSMYVQVGKCLITCLIILSVCAVIVNVPLKEVVLGRRVGGGERTLTVPVPGMSPGLPVSGTRELPERAAQLLTAPDTRPTGIYKVLRNESIFKQGMNEILNSISYDYDRNVTDLRHAACREAQVQAQLPTVSVVLVFHAEPLPLLLSALLSVLRNTHITHTAGGVRHVHPLREVILVDDHSKDEEVRRKLHHFIRTHLPPGVVSVFRMPRRLGEAGARMAGVRGARSEAVVLMSVRCRLSPGWLPPLLHHLRAHPRAAALPVIHYTHHANHTAAPLQVGDFSLAGQFAWIDIPQREQWRLRHASPIAPVRSATMSGEVFAIMKQRFWELGAYDEQMSGWTADHIEMSFKIWMCGGSVVIVPCSHVSLVHRDLADHLDHADLLDHADHVEHVEMPLSSYETQVINMARVAAIWMDDYKEIFYLLHPYMRNNSSVGDVSERRMLREELHCRSFRWYLNKVCPYKIMPVRDTVAFGRFQMAGAEAGVAWCVSSVGAGAVGAGRCGALLTAPQLFMLTSSGALMANDLLCVQGPTARNSQELEQNLSLVPCDWKEPLPSQRWQLEAEGQVRHESTHRCLSLAHTAPAPAPAPQPQGGAVLPLRVSRCAHLAHRWHPEYTKTNTANLSLRILLDSQ